MKRLMAVVGCVALVASGCGDHYRYVPIDAAVDAAPQPDAAEVDAAVPDAAPEPDAAPPDAAPPDAAPQDGGGVCSNNSGCNPTEYCDKANCIAATGVCVPRPTICTNDEDPVCGCNGVNFWNDCIRQQEGVVLHSSAVCNTMDNMCGGILQTPCPTSTDCAYLFQNSATCQIVNPEGQCWVVPVNCPSTSTVKYRPCGNPTGTCMGKCAAIKNGNTFYADATCP